MNKKNVRSAHVSSLFIRSLSSLLPLRLTVSLVTRNHFLKPFGHSYRLFLLISNQLVYWSWSSTLKSVLLFHEFGFKIKDFNTGMRVCSCNDISRIIFISHDRTRIEREAIRRIYTELDLRKNNGESNITIRYRHGIPFIVLAAYSFRVFYHLLKTRSNKLMIYCPIGHNKIFLNSDYYN